MYMMPAFTQSQRGESRFQSVERHGDQVVARATKWLAGNKQRPFFLMGAFARSSAPYWQSYDHAVAAADCAVGKLISFLRAQSLYDDSLIVVASPHGESLGAHGEDTHGIFLYDETIHVPLVLKLPKNRMAGKASRKIARGSRILRPPCWRKLEFRCPHRCRGSRCCGSRKRVRRATSRPTRAAIFRSRASDAALLESWRAGKYLYIRAPNPELYDLSADPKATHNLAQSAKATLETLASQLQVLRQPPGK